MKFGKRIILVNSLVIAILTAVIVIAATVAGTTVLRNNTKNFLIDTVTSRAAIISQNKGIVPSDFDYDVNGVYLSVYLSDGTLKNGSFPGEVDLPIKRGVITSVKIDGKRYYCYDFVVAIEGRDDIYLRGILARSYDVWFIAVICVAVFAGLTAAVGIIFNIASVKRTIAPIDQIRKEVRSITASGDLKKRLSEVKSDEELNRLIGDYNFMLDSLENMFVNQERFTSDVAHELRTPLSVILSESEYALRETEDMSEKNNSLAVIYRRSKSLKAIIDGMLEFTRLADKMTIAMSPVDISALIEEFIGDYIFGRGIKCNADIQKGVMVAVDVTLFERVLQNIFDNSVKYGRENGNVFVKLYTSSNSAVLEIGDDGIGMSEEERSHAFDRFYRAQKSRSDKSGLGLGLSFVKEIVRLFGAKIEISSHLGEGTTVKLTFKLCE